MAKWVLLLFSIRKGFTECLKRRSNERIHMTQAVWTSHLKPYPGDGFYIFDSCLHFTEWRTASTDTLLKCTWLDHSYFSYIGQMFFCFMMSANKWLKSRFCLSTCLVILKQDNILLKLNLQVNMKKYVVKLCVWN